MSETRSWLWRWLFEYNPMYLVSAALTLAGVIALSQGVAETGGVMAQMGITAITELYAWALIGSAALLVRRRHRRPAVMLALLAALYQCDLTLHTATCALLGTVGALGSALWLLGFVAKLRALAWAMQLRLSRGASLTILAGGAGLAGLPWVLREVGGPLAAAIVAGWLFGLLAGGLWSSRRIGSLVPLDEWGVTVARRSLRAVWIGLAAMAVFHTGFWTAQHASIVHPGVFVPMAALLGTRFIDGEVPTWAAVVGTLAWVVHAQPSQLALTAAMAAVVLLLRAFRSPMDVTPRPQDHAITDPYRAPIVQADPVAPYRIFGACPAPERRRLVAGAIACLYLAAWTIGYTGAEWPEHLAALDLLLLAVGVLGWRRGHRLPMLPVSLAVVHWIATSRVVPTPTSTLQWGVAGVVAGFVLLGLSLLGSLRFGRRPAS